MSDRIASGIRIDGGDSTRRQDPTWVDPVHDVQSGFGRVGERFGTGFGDYIGFWVAGFEIFGARRRDGE